MIWRGDDSLHNLFPLYLLTDKLKALVTAHLIIDVKMRLFCYLGKETESGSEIH
jgi:hypothetical protein